MTARELPTTHLLLSAELLLVCSGILMGVGLVSAFVPALRASRLDPIAPRCATNSQYA